MKGRGRKGGGEGRWCRNVVKEGGERKGRKEVEGRKLKDVKRS